MQLPDSFSALPDSATVRVVPVEGGLPSADSRSVLAVLEELLAQWSANQAIEAGAVAPLEGGHFLLVAWVPRAGDLSGCTKDGLTHTLLALEKQLGKRMLNAPRLAVAGGDGEACVRFLDREAFKEGLRNGTIAADSTVYDHLVTTLGDIRAGRFRTTVAGSWYERIRP